MPPIPIAYDENAEKLIESLQRRQKDLHDFQIPRLRTCTGPLSVQQQYAAEIREDMDGFARQVEVRSPVSPFFLILLEKRRKVSNSVLKRKGLNSLSMWL